jgi:hypothetical protein
VLLIVVLTTTGLILGLSPAGPLSSVLAAVNGTPTSTTTETNSPAATTTPAPPATPLIELVNPSAYVTPVVVSNKADEDTSYHLVAWVANVTAMTTPVVQFEITPQNETIVASRIGDTNTWHAFWTMNNQTDGPHTVTARLFDGATERDSDAQDVTVAKSQETVEMTYPTNGGGLGTYHPQPGAVERGFVVDATVSSGATGVMVFYGTSHPGTEQNWRRCTIQETVSFSAPGNRRIGCTIASGISATEITGVAAVATGTDELDPGPPPNCLPGDFVDPGPPPLCPTVDSGDAHRVTSYAQAPSSVTVTPSTSNAATSTCQVLTATIVDSQSRPIWRANIDVHATGPADDLQFGRVTGRTRDWQPADAAGTHDGTEPTHNCGGSGTPPAQAEHNQPGADEKHIETKRPDQPEGGSDTSGTFTFALRSAQAGMTGVEAYNDIDDNDTRETEPLGTATITWTAPTPSQSASATRSPTTSPSATRSPTTSPSATRSPSATSSPSATRSPTTSPTGSSTQGPASRTVTLETSRNSTVFGRRVVFSGAINSSNSECEAAETVRIQEQTVGAPGFTDVGFADTDPTGAYGFGYKPPANASYRAVVDPSPQCQEAISSTRAMLVRVRVGLKVSDGRVPKGSKVRLNVTIAPCGNHADTEVALDRNTGRGWDEIGRKGVNESCKATFKKRVSKTARFRARWPSQDDNHESGVSPKRRVRVFTLRRRNF